MVLRTVSPESVIALAREIGLLKRRPPSRLSERSAFDPGIDGPFVGVAPEEIPAATFSENEIIPGVGDINVFFWNEATQRLVRHDELEPCLNVKAAPIPASTGDDIIPFAVDREHTSGIFYAAESGEPQDEPEHELTGCSCLDLQNVVAVTIQLRDVLPPIVGDDDGEIGVGNEANDPPGLCNRCREWNDEIVLWHIGGCVFVEAQAGGGYTPEPSIYLTEKGGRHCFGCASLGDDTGMRLTITCNGDGTIGATLDVQQLGCAMAVYTWEDLDPCCVKMFTCWPADTISPESKPGWWLTIEECYRPKGACRTDPTELFPACITDGWDWWYDMYNCRHSVAQDDEDPMPCLRFYVKGDPGIPTKNNSACEPCGTHKRRIQAKDEDQHFAVVPGGDGTAEIIDDADARDGKAWKISAGALGDSTIRAYHKLPDADGQCQLCIYARYKHEPLTPILDVATVTVTLQGGGTPPNENWTLEEAKDGYDGAHTTHEFDGYRYQLLGCFWVDNGEVIQIDIEGPGVVTHAVYIDELIVIGPYDEDGTPSPP